MSNILDKISFWSLFLSIILLPVFFLPFTQIPIETSKGLLVVAGLALSIIFWAMARFKDGKISLPKSGLLLAGLGIVMASFLSALFSETLQVSLFGTMLDIGASYFMLSAFLLMLFSSILFKDRSKTRALFLGLIIFSIILFLFQSFRLFVPNILLLGVLGGKTDNILGSWSAFGLFAGLVTLISLFIIEFFSVSKTAKWFFGILVIFSLMLSAAVNFSLVWILLGIFSLIIFVYKISFSFSQKHLLAEEPTEREETKREGKSFPVFSFAAVIISLLFLMSGQFIGGFLPSRLGLSNIEVGPSLEATISVTKGVLATHPVLGTGPNKFGEAWAAYKPEVINSTQFWDTSFNSGSGTLPTFISTTGILGTLSWLLFFILFLIAGVKSIFYSIKNHKNFEMVAFFIFSLYLFVASFFYSAGEVILMLSFAFTGVFIGLFSSREKEKGILFSFLDDPRKSFSSIFILVVLMIISMALAFKYIERLASVQYFGKTLSAPTIPIAEDFITKAISLYQNDLYLRTYAQIYLTKTQSIIAKGGSLSEADKADLQTNVNQAVRGAQLAVEYNKGNYLNYYSLGVVYDALRVFGVKDVALKGIEAYQKASALSPLNPGIKLAIARVFFALEKIKEARNYANEALTLKSDYIEALIVLSQIEKKSGNDAAAVSYAEKALSFAPNNKDLIQYVNSLKNERPVPTTFIPSALDDTKKEQ